MRFQSLLLADAMNVGSDGKVNALGLGVRLITYPQLPGASPLSVLANIVAEPSEAGLHDAEFCLLLPDGTEEELFRTTVNVTVDADTPDATMVSVMLGFSMLRPFIDEGVHAVRVKVGVVSAEYKFRVQAARSAQVPTPESAQPTDQEATEG